LSAAFLASSFKRMAVDFHNAILGRLCQMVQMSGAEMAASLGMPRSTFAAAIAQLEEQGLVVQAGKANGGRGRPSYVYRLKLPMPVVSPQVEGTQLSGGLFDESLELLALETVPLLNVQTLAGAIEACGALLESLLETSHACQVRPGGVAVSLNAVQAAASLCDELRLAAVSFCYPAIQSGGTTP